MSPAHGPPSIPIVPCRNACTFSSKRQRKHLALLVLAGEYDQADPRNWHQPVNRLLKLQHLRPDIADNHLHRAGAVHNHHNLEPALAQLTDERTGQIERPVVGRILEASAELIVAEAMLAAEPALDLPANLAAGAQQTTRHRRFVLLYQCADLPEWESIDVVVREPTAVARIEFVEHAPEHVGENREIARAIGIRHMREGAVNRGGFGDCAALGVLAADLTPCVGLRRSITARSHGLSGLRP